MLMRPFLLIAPMLMMNGVNAAESRTILDIVEQKCAICHGDNGEGSSAYPRLAGQNAEYIAKQSGRLQKWSSRGHHERDGGGSHQG